MLYFFTLDFSSIDRLHTIIGETNGIPFRVNITVRQTQVFKAQICCDILHACQTLISFLKPLGWWLCGLHDSVDSSFEKIRIAYYMDRYMFIIIHCSLCCCLCQNDDGKGEPVIIAMKIMLQEDTRIVGSDYVFQMYYITQW